MLDLFREIGQTMRSNGRTILTGISVSWGVFMLILLLGMAKGLVNAFEANQTSEKHGQNQRVERYHFQTLEDTPMAATYASATPTCSRWWKTAMAS